MQGRKSPSTQRRFPKLGAALALYGALASTPARAEPPIPGLTPEQAAQCGQDCMYKRANENTLLQAQTSIFELSYLDAHPNEIDRTLGEFCTINKTSGADCLKLYKSAQARHIQNLRGNIAIHSDMAAKLNTYLDQPGAQVEFTQGQPAGGARAPAPITPYAPTIRELSVQTNGGIPMSNGAPMGAEERAQKYQAWIQSITKPVDAADPAFAKTQSRASSRDPGVKYYSIVPGSPDAAALKAAQEFAKKNEAEYARLGGNATDQAAVQETMLKSIEAEQKSQAAVRDPAERLRSQTPVAREAAYGVSRQIVVDAALGKVATKAPAPAPSSTARKPASGTPPAPGGETSLTGSTSTSAPSAGSIPLWDQTLDEQARTSGATPKNFVLPSVDAIDQQVMEIESMP